MVVADSSVEAHEEAGAVAHPESDADPSPHVDETAVLRTPVSLCRRTKPAGTEQVYVMQPRISGEKDKQRYVVSVSKKASNSYEAIGDRIVQMVNDGEITTVGQCKKKLQAFLDDGHTVD